MSTCNCLSIDYNIIMLLIIIEDVKMLKFINRLWVLFTLACVVFIVYNLGYWVVSLRHDLHHVYTTQEASLKAQ